MSDASDKGSTAPMNARRPATQVSASAVPSTMESPAEPGKLDATIRMDDAAPEEVPAHHAGEEISGALVAHEAALRHGGATAPVARRGAAPATKMSPAVDPQAFRQAGPDPKPEEAVTIAPAFPIVDPAAAARGGTFQSGGLYDAQGQYSGPGPGVGPGRARSGMSGLTIALIIGGIVLVLAAIGVGLFAFVVVRSRAAVNDPPALMTASASPLASAAPPAIASPTPPPPMVPATAIPVTPPLTPPLPTGTTKKRGVSHDR